jgi:hypothetical protein
MALPCFHEALLKSAQHPWLWTDYARALQGVVRGGLVAAVAGRRQRQRQQQQPTDCPAAAVAEELAALQGWGQQLAEAEAAADVALMLGGGADDVSAAWRVRQRLGGTARRLGAAFQALAGRRCGDAGVAAAVLAAVRNASRAWSAGGAARRGSGWLAAAVARGEPTSLGAAIRLSRARCAREADVTVRLRGHHDHRHDRRRRRQGWALGVREALLCLRVCGVVKIQGAWPARLAVGGAPSWYHDVAAAHRQEFEAFLSSSDVDSAAARSNGSSRERATRRGVQVGVPQTYARCLCEIEYL